MGIRSTAKAVIINGNKVLLNKCYDENNGEYFSLPGGGQNQYETMHEAIVRECLEETGYTVKPVRFASLCEEICDDMNIRERRPDYAHKMLHIFVCELVDNAVRTPTETDNMQIGIEWVDIKNLSDIRLLPKTVGENILNIINNDRPLFLGSEHIPFNHG